MPQGTLCAQGSNLLGCESGRKVLEVQEESLPLCCVCLKGWKQVREDAGSQRETEVDEWVA